MRRRMIGTATVALPGLAALLASPAAAQTAGPSRLQAVQQAGVIRFATTGDFNPMSFRDPASRELRGHQIDCANQLARDMNLRAEFVPAEWRTLVSGLQAGQYDAVFAGTSMSVARAMAASFTIPWGRNAFLPLVQRANADRFKDWDDLNRRGVTIGTTLGTTMEQFVQQALPNATLRRVESPARDWQELLAGRVDATMSSLVEAAFLTREYPQLVAIFADRPRNPIPMAFMSPAGDHTWLAFLNAWVTIRQASGFFDEVNARWGIVQG